MRRFDRLWDDGLLLFSLGKSSDGCYNNISVKLVHKTELCEQQQTTKAAFWEFENLTNENDVSATFNCIHYCHMTVWTMRLGKPHHTYFRKSKTQSKILSSQSMRSPLFRRAHERLVERVSLSMKDIPFFFGGHSLRAVDVHRTPPDTHSLTWCFLRTWTKAFSVIHACARDYPIPLFPYLAISDENTLLCNCKVSSVSSQTHERMRDRQHDLRFSSGALKMRASLVLYIFYSTIPYIVCRLVNSFGLDWGFLLFSLCLGPCE